MNAGAVDINFDAKTASFTTGSEAVVKDLDAIKQHAEQTATTLAHLKAQTAGPDLFDDLKESLGKRSALGESVHLLEGGGPIAGLTGAANLLKEMADKAKDLKEQFESGKITAGELTEKLVEGIPIIGQFWSAGQAINALFPTDAEQALTDANEQSKLLDDSLRDAKENMKLLRDAAKEFGDIQKEANRETEIANAKTPEEKEALRKKFKDEDEGTKVDEVAKKLSDDAEKQKADILKAQQDAVIAEQKLSDLKNDKGVDYRDPYTGKLSHGGGPDQGAIQEAQSNADMANSIVILKQKELSDTLAQIAAQATAAKAALKVASDAETAEHDRKVSDDAAKALIEHNKKMAQLTSQGKEEALRAKGDIKGAEDEVAKRTFDSEVAGANGDKDLMAEAQTKYNNTLAKNAADEKIKQQHTLDEAKRKSNEEDARAHEKELSFIRENGTALEKYQLKLEEIAAIKGKVSDANIKSATDKAKAEYEKAEFGDETKRAAAQIQDYNFTAAPEAKFATAPVDDEKQMKKQQADDIHSIAQHFAQTRPLGQDAPTLIDNFA